VLTLLPQNQTQRHRGKVWKFGFGGEDRGFTLKFSITLVQCENKTTKTLANNALFN
jgi:hypothetical protein